MGCDFPREGSLHVLSFWGTSQQQSFLSFYGMSQTCHSSRSCLYRTRHRHVTTAVFPVFLWHATGHVIAADSQQKQEIWKTTIWRWNRTETRGISGSLCPRQVRGRALELHQDTVKTPSIASVLFSCTAQFASPQETLSFEPQVAEDGQRSTLHNCLQLTLGCPVY